MNKIFWVASGLLILAVFNLPIGYYTFLRIIVSIAAGYAIYNEYKGDFNYWILSFGLILILFNPIIPIYLHNKGPWIPIDLIVAGLFAYKAWKDDSEDEKTTKSAPTPPSSDTTKETSKEKEKSTPKLKISKNLNTKKNK